MGRQSQSAPSTSMNSTTSSAPGGKRNLKKNQACLPCRRGKMKCDAVQPHCTNCVKAWEALVVAPPVPGFVPPEGPTCYYDPVEGLVFTPEKITDPAVRAKVIEEQLAKLQEKLQEEREVTGRKRPSTSSSQSSSSSKRQRRDTVDDRPPQLPPTPNAGPDPSGTLSNTGFLAPSAPHSTSRPSSAGSNQGPHRPFADLPEPELLSRLVDLFLSNEPHASRTLHVPSLHAAVLSMRQNGPTNEQYLSSHPQAPSQALLHAICASAARYYNASCAPCPSPNLSLPDITITQTNHAGHIHSLHRSRPQRSSTMPSPSSSYSGPPSSSNSPRLQPNRSRTNPTTSQGSPSFKPSTPLPEDFATFHLGRARHLINTSILEHEHVGAALPPGSRSGVSETRKSTSSSQSTLSNTLQQRGSMPMSTRAYGAYNEDGDESDDDEDDDELEDLSGIREARDALIFREVLQPLLILTTFHYHEAKALEVWTNVGSLTRVAISLRLHHPPSNFSHLSISPPSRGVIENEERRRAFWSAYILDRLVSTGGWSHSVFEQDSVPNYRGQFPIMSTSEFKELGASRQSASTMHSLSYPTPLPALDSFSLLIETSIIFGRVTEYNIRRSLRRRPATQGSLPHSTSTSILATSTDTSTDNIDPMSKWDFRELDTLLGAGSGMVLGKGDPFALSGSGLVPGQSQGGNAKGGHLAAKFRTPIGVMDSLIPGADAPPLDRGPGKEALGTLGGGGVLDTDLYLAHIMGHTAMILLHLPYARFNSEASNGNSVSSGSNLPTPPETSPFGFSIPSHADNSESMGNDFGMRWILGDYSNREHASSLMAAENAFNSHSPFPADNRRPSTMENMMRPHSSMENRTGRPSTMENAARLPPSTDGSTGVPHSIPFSRRNSFNFSNNVSAGRCVKAATSIYDALRLIRATTFDISKLHPFVTTGWYIAAIVFVYEHRRLVSPNDSDNTEGAALEIQALRSALLEYGTRSPIGNHHEQQLLRAISTILPGTPLETSVLVSNSVSSSPSHHSSSLSIPKSTPSGRYLPHNPYASTASSSESLLIPSPQPLPIPLPPLPPITYPIKIPIFPFDQNPQDFAPLLGHSPSIAALPMSAPLPAIGVGPS